MKTFKFLPRLFAVFGLTMMCAVSGWTANSPVINLSCAQLALNEGNSTTTNVTCTVTLSVSPDSKAIDVTIATSNGSATSGSDYVALNTTYTFADGTTTLTKDFNISVNGDTTYEPDETFSVGITAVTTNPQNFTLGTSSKTITITNDDTVPSMSVANVSMNEGSSGGDTNMVFTATLNHPSSTTATVHYATLSGTATSATFDYTDQSGTLTFAPGETSKTISVPIRGDTFVESNEAFSLNFTVPSGLTLATTSATGTILNDDADVPLISIADQSLAEGNSGTQNMVFTVTVTNMQTNTVTVNYATADGSNSALLSNNDYTAISGTLTFSPGASTQTQTILVPIVGDTVSELNEYFLLNLTNPTGSASITVGQARGNIIDDDSGGSCSPYVGQLTINEYNFIPGVKDEFGNQIPGSGNFIELRVIGQTLRDAMIADFNFVQNWKVEIYNQANTPNVPRAYKLLPARDPNCDFATSGYLVYTFNSSDLTEGATTIVVKDNQNRIVDILYYGNSSALYTPSTCSFVYDTNMTQVTNQNKDVFRIPDGTGDWTDFGSGANSGATRCTNPGSGFVGIHTIFDAFDYKTPVTSADIGNPITTKIVNKNIRLTAISTNSTHTGLADSVNVAAWLARKSGTEYFLVKALQEIDFTHNSSVGMDSFTRANAGKDHVIAFKYCDDNGTYKDYTVCWPTGISAQQRVGISWDNFAIRPNEFNTTLTAGQMFTAKQPASITIRANAYTGLGSADYNEAENISFKADVNISDSTKTCAQSSITFSPSIVFVDGNVTGSYSFDNVGDFNVTIHEISGAEYALVDATDTTSVNRLITPYIQQIKVKPANFNIDGNLTNGSNGFSYLSNFQDYNTTASRNVSAGLDLNITARAFDNNVTSNYTGTCYAKDGNISVNINAFAMTPAGNVTKMLWYEKNHDTNGSMAIPTTNFVLPITHTAFDAAGANGTALVKYLLNFDRNQTKTVDPKSMIVTNITATDADAVTGVKVPTTNSAYYVYGRIIPRDVRVFGQVPFTANAWYEVFGTNTIGVTALPASKNDASWYTNTLHLQPSDGNASVTVVSGGSLPATTTYASGIVSYNFNAITAANIPYTGKAHIDTDPWLWYGTNASSYLDPANPANLDCMTHPCFNINVVPAVGATGSAITGSEANKASKKSTSEAGAGGWKSTSDYAPAVR